MTVWALDIETKNEDISSLDFNNPKGWEISCICLYNSDNQYFYFVDNFMNTQPYAIFRNEPKANWYRQNLSEFEEWFNRKIVETEELVVTKNGSNFDFPIIEEYLGIELPYFRHIDLEEYVTIKIGERWRLNEMIAYHLGEEGSKLMDASYAPRFWNEGFREIVIGYCLDDCKKTLEVFNDAKSKGKLGMSVISMGVTFESKDILFPKVWA